MQFPRLVFRSPGPEQCQGGTYAHAGVADQEAFDVALAAGWHATLPDALAPPPSPVATMPIDIAMPAQEPAEPVNQVTQIDLTPPTRDEMKRQAAALGIEYRHNISNVALADLIDAALAQEE